MRNPVLGLNWPKTALQSKCKNTNKQSRCNELIEQVCFFFSWPLKQFSYLTSNWPEFLVWKEDYFHVMNEWNLQMVQSLRIETLNICELTHSCRMTKILTFLIGSQRKWCNKEAPYRAYAIPSNPKYESCNSILRTLCLWFKLRFFKANYIFLYKCGMNFIHMQIFKTTYFIDCVLQISRLENKHLILVCWENLRLTDFAEVGNGFPCENRSHINMFYSI